MTPKFQIEKIHIHWGQMPVALVFSYGKVSTFSFLIVRVWSQGLEGLGEVLAPPNDFLFHRLAPSLVGADARARDQLLPVTDNDHDRILCEACSIALHDLVAKGSDLPLYALLGGAKDTRVPLMPCIFPHTPDEAKTKAQALFAQGYRYLKTKLIGVLDEDCARIRAIRSVAPSGIVLQGDANCGYKALSDAKQAVEALGTEGLDLFEDPLDGGAEDYAALRERLNGRGAKVMVDALARRTADLVSVLKLQAADAVGIHPDQPGSLTLVLRHVQLAQAFGVPVVIGGTGYTGIGTAAYQHITAVATPGGPCGELGGFFDHGMPKNMAQKPLTMADGFVRLPERPGMGIELNEAVLAEFQEGQREWRV